LKIVFIQKLARPLIRTSGYCDGRSGSRGFCNPKYGANVQKVLALPRGIEQIHWKENPIRLSQNICPVIARTLTR
jgi:hypothetical protein